MSRVNTNTRQHGFTLIEVLVAFAILALFLGAVMPSLSTSMSASRAGSESITATAYAQSLIAGVGVNARLAEGTFTNTLEQPRFSSTLTVRPHPGQTAQQGDAGLYVVTASVTWPAGAGARGVTLTTYRFAKGQ
jgi:general secretion pathway protein I